MTRTILFIFSLLFFKNLTAQTNPDSLVVFVGQKIKLEHVEQKAQIDTIYQDNDTLYRVSNVPMDSKFIATYFIVQKLNGHFHRDTIEFIVYYHYGEPPFVKHDQVLLFISPFNGNYYHEKYQYFPVYKTRNDRWAGTYSASDYSHPLIDEKPVEPEIIEFETQPVIDLKSFSDDYIAKNFFEPYYKIEEQKAIAVYGNYIEELFVLKQKGVLKARGIYKD